MKILMILLSVFTIIGCYRDRALDRVDSGFMYRKNEDYCFTTKYLMEDNQLVDLTVIVKT